MKQKISAYQSAFFRLVILFMSGLTSSVALAAPHLSRDQLKHFDSVFAEKEKSQCLTQGPATRETWLLGEIKKLGEADPKIQNVSRDIWKSQVVDFKVDGGNVPAWWVRPSLGTFGVNAGKPFQASSKDGQTVMGEVVDLGRGTLAELDASKGLQNHFWLIEKSDAVPEVSVLAFEARSRGAAGLIIYENKKILTSPNSLTDNVGETLGAQGMTLPVAVVEVSADVAKKIKEGLRAKPVEIKLALKTEYPVTEEGHSILLKKGVRDQQTFVVINEDDCFAIGKSLAFFQWLNRANMPVQGTTFVFFSQKSFSDNKFVQGWGNPAFQINMTEAGESVSDANKFLNQWFKSDQNPDDAFDVKPILKKANAIEKDLKGFVSGEELKKYNELLKWIEKPDKSFTAAHGPIHYKLAQVVGPLDFSERVSDLKFLRQAHALAEKGQWDQAIAAIRHVSDFQWAANVSPEAFVEYEKRREASGVPTPDPAIWAEAQKGKQNVDALIELLEREIDRLDHQLSDNFFKLQKSIEEFQKI